MKLSSQRHTEHYKEIETPIAASDKEAFEHKYTHTSTKQAPNFRRLSSPNAKLPPLSVKKSVGYIVKASLTVRMALRDAPIPVPTALFLGQHPLLC